MAEPVILDGSEGEGGGQILRTALTLSMATGRSFRIKRIRAKRGKPGLMRQHLTAVMAAARISSADVEGAALGSMELSFRPGPVQAGDYDFSVGTAGSTSLVFQTLMPALMLASKPSLLTLEGGTHNPASPCLDFLQKTYLPCLAAMGVDSEITLERRGYYPAGGGRWHVRISPAAVQNPFEKTERGVFLSVMSKVIWSGIPDHVVQREVRHLKARQVLEEAPVEVEEDRLSQGPGNVVLIEMKYSEITEVVSAFGARGRSAEEVVEEAVREAGEYRNGGVPVGPHLADQLLVPMALGMGGVFRTMPLTTHARTNIETIGRFLDSSIESSALKDHSLEVRVRGLG